MAAFRRLSSNTASRVPPSHETNGIQLRMIWMKTSCPILVLLVLAGCSGAEQGEVFDPAEWQGQVDRSLPPDVQAKQDAVIRLFDAMITVGVEFEFLNSEYADITFTESEQDFFEGAMDLFRWDWDGPPQGNDFPVQLTMRKDDPSARSESDLPLVEFRRVYTVTGSPGRFVIVRRR